MGGDKKLFGQVTKKNIINEIQGSNDSKAMANSINDFFCDIGYNLVSNIPDSLLQPDYSVIQGIAPLELQLATFEVFISCCRKVLTLKQVEMMGSL